MMGLLIACGVALMTGLLIWRFGRLHRGTIELVGAALLIGIAGYAWQGRPGEPGQPVKAVTEGVEIDPALVAQRKALTGQFGTEAQWLDYADTLERLGQTRLAVVAMQSGLRENPKSANLWVGLGNALVVHGGGMMSPSAEFAFQRAADLAPEHPGPPFFFGLALAQSGRFDDADRIWTALLARTPPDAPWRADLVSRLNELKQQKAG